MLARFIIGTMLMIALVAGLALYYLQIYAYYDEVSLQTDDVQLTSIFTGAPEPILFENYQDITKSSMSNKESRYCSPVKSASTATGGRRDTEDMVTVWVENVKKLDILLFQEGNL